MFIDKFHRTWNGPFPFTEGSIIQNAPGGSGVYQIFYQGEPVYIGISGSSIKRRLARHMTGIGNWAAARRSDLDGYRFVYFLCDGQTAKQIESHVVTAYKPPFNVRPELKHYIDNITVH